MRVRRVEVLRSPGVAPGFTAEGFGPGLTIIEGRNESGKSTLAGAIRALLWPERSATLQARGEFADGERVYHAFIDPHAGGWQGEAPALPDRAAGRGMIVGIGDLWREDDHDRAVRDAMTRELQGGYDLEPLHESAQRRSPTAPMRDARDAERALGDARNRARALMEREASLPGLKARAARDRAVANRKPLVEKAIERLTLLERLSALRHELGAMPEGARRVVGNEGEQFRSLREAIDEATAAAEREHATAAEASQRVADTVLPEGGVPAEDMALLERLWGEVSALEPLIGEARRQAARCQAEADATAVDAYPLDAKALDCLDAALAEAQEARARRASDKVAAEQWTPPGAPGANRWWPIAAMVAALLAAVAAGLASAWIAVGLALLAAGLALFAALRKPGAMADPLPQLRDRARRSDEECERALRGVRELAGDDGELASTLSLVTAARRAGRQDEIVRELLGARANLESLVAQRGELLARAAAALAPYDDAGCDTPDALHGAVVALGRRHQQHEQFSQRAREAAARATDHEKRRARAEAERAALLERLGLSEDRLAELGEWLRLRQNARELADRVREGEALLGSLDESLRSSPELLELDRAALDAEREACDQAGASADTLREEIGGIESEIRNARAGADVGRAIADLERAARAVADARDNECAKAARRLVLEHAIAGMQRDDMPALVRQADELLSRFTANAYGLRIGARSEPEVYDQRSGAAKDAEQLSTGTRAQALLAMRLAGAFEAERRAGATALPLVLDEPLATTDDQRFEAIAAATFRLAHEGRQIIYLTCEPAHARRLERLAGEHDLPCARLDLDAIRGRQATDRNPSEALLEPRPQPTPATTTREAYLRWRGVRPLDPWASTDAIDLFHLVGDDLDTLHALHMRGITTAGQVAAQAARAGEGFPWPDLVRRCRCATRLVRAWRVGRARAVTMRDILDSDAVSEKYVERVAEINAEVGGSAVALLAALETGQAKGFRSNKIEQLRDYLQTHGFLPTEPPAAIDRVLHEALDGLVMGSSDQETDALLAVANRLLDTLAAGNSPADEAPAERGA